MSVYRTIGPLVRDATYKISKHRYLYEIFELSMDENDYNQPFKKGLENVWEVSEKSGNSEMDFEWQP